MFSVLSVVFSIVLYFSILFHSVLYLTWISWIILHSWPANSRTKVSELIGSKRHIIIFHIANVVFNCFQVVAQFCCTMFVVVANYLLSLYVVLSKVSWLLMVINRFIHINKKLERHTYTIGRTNILNRNMILKKWSILPISIELFKSLV